MRLLFGFRSCFRDWPGGLLLCELVFRGYGLAGDEEVEVAVFRRRGFGCLGSLGCGGGLLLRLPLEGVGGEKEGQLGQCDRLFGGVDNGFQLCFQAHSTIGTSSMVPDVERPCVFGGRCAC